MASKEYWIDLAEYDLATAKAMLDTKRYLYVGFMCHQCIEKVLKAFCVYRGLSNPPYTHNLLTLVDKADLMDQFSEKQLDFLDFLQPLNIEARYPETKQKLLDVLTNERCIEIYTKTKELYKWVKMKL